MVGIAQLVERWLVVPDVAGSSPVTHPIQTRSESKDSGLFCSPVAAWNTPMGYLVVFSGLSEGTGR